MDGYKAQNDGHCGKGNNAPYIFSFIIIIIFHILYSEMKKVLIFQCMFYLHKLISKTLCFTCILNMNELAVERKMN